MKQITIYTDGACKGNPGPGGWGAILIHNAIQKQLSGAEKETTNNRMELTAVIQALSALKSPCKIDLFTDSKYVKDGSQTWIHGWIRNNWKSSNKSDVKNKDLWILLYEQLQKHTINFFWVKGHSGDPLNELADKLATNAINKTS